MNFDNLFDASKIEIKSDVSKIDEVLQYEQILLSISKAIINYRKENNVTQKELAEILNVNQVMISKLERGNYNPTIKLLYSLSRQLTKSSDLFIDILKDIITSLYKSKNITYSMQYKIYETYKYTDKIRNNMVYINYRSSEKDIGGIFYEQAKCTSQLSIS